MVIASMCPRLGLVDAAFTASRQQDGIDSVTVYISGE